MKKLFVLFLILNIAVGLALAADTKTYTYGTVKISQDNELPSGYFTKAKNYLPGDSISISNPQNGTEVNVLNLGTLEDSGDVAILLAPEVATKLGIDFSVQLRIKLSPRPDDFDEIASGTGILSYGASVYDEDDYSLSEETPVSVADVANEEPVENYVAEESFSGFEDEELSDVEAEAETKYDSTAVETVPETEYITETFVESTDEDDEVIEPVADLSALYEPAIAESFDDSDSVEETVAVEPVVDSKNTDSAEEEPVFTSPVIEDVQETAVAEFKEPEPVVPVVPEKNEQKFEQIYDTFEPVEEEVTDYFLSETEPVPPSKSNEPSAKDTSLEKITSEPLSAVENTIEEDFSTQKKNTEKPSVTVIEKISDEPIASAEPFNFTDSVETDAITDEPEVKVIADTEDDESDYFEEEEVEEEVYVPEIEEIVETTSVFSLNPTEAVSPKYDPRYARQPPKPKEKAKPVPAPKKEEPKKKEPPKKVTPPAEQKNVVVKDKNLRNGSYYIQIATVTTSDAGMKIVNKYDKYPIILVPFDTREGYKVMVGPLTGDEYGAVLEKFKAFGYRDAFIRKIK